MPRHEQVSPEEDLAAFYGGADPRVTAGASPPAQESPAPVAVSLAPAPERPSPPAVAPRPTAAPPAAPRQDLVPSGRAVPAPSTGLNPVLAAVISFFLPGVGQLLCGQTVKGIVLLVLAFFTCWGGGLLSVLAALDAFLIAQRKERGEALGEWQFF